MSEAKPFWKSKTLWANLAVVLVGVADQFIAGGLIPPEWTPTVLGFVGVVNVILRTVTTAPLTTAAEKA